VLLHGFPETWYCWRHQIPVLAEKFRVIVPDLRGYGRTEKPGEKSSPSAARCGTFARFGKRLREIHRFSRCPSVATFRTRKNHRKSTQRCSSFSKGDKTEDPTKQSNAGVSARIPLTEYRLDVVSTRSPACWRGRRCVRPLRRSHHFREMWLLIIPGIGGTGSPW
jgi:hypothetical protein